MGDIIYKYINYEDEKFKQVINLRYSILFEPFNKIEKYNFDELDEISLHLVALDKDKVIGYSRMTISKGKAKITNVVVSLNYINRGIGFDMMKKHIIKAKENDMSCVYLNARLDTVKFYKKVGFEGEGEVFTSSRSGLPLQKMFINF